MNLRFTTLVSYAVCVFVGPPALSQTYIPSWQFQEHLHRSNIELPAVSAGKCVSPRLTFDAKVNERGEVVAVKEKKFKSRRMAWPRELIQQLTRRLLSLRVLPFRDGNKNATVKTVVEMRCVEE